MKRTKPCVWLKHGPYEGEEKIYCQVPDPGDEDRFTEMVPFEEYEELMKITEELKLDLFYQIESKHGPKIASEYPSILKFKEFLEREN